MEENNNEAYEEHRLSVNGLGSPQQATDLCLPADQPVGSWLKLPSSVASFTAASAPTAVPSSLEVLQNSSKNP